MNAGAEDAGPGALAVDPAPLHAWFAAHQRALPFRRTRDFYPIWVSEIMLQQTRVAAMVPRYTEFMRTFPTVRALAGAEESEVLAAWRGLGYYSRARNLRAGARQVVEEHGGEFPRTLDAALRIRGVGRYTAAAVLSMAYGVPLAVLDGNVKRVLARLGHWPSAADTQLQSGADALLGARGACSPGDHNQAVMELGALVCTPGVPDCAACPLAGQCRTYARGGAQLAADIPGRRSVAPPLRLGLDVFLIVEAGGDRVLTVRERDSRFFKNLWFFPYRFSGETNFPRLAPPGMDVILGAGADSPVTAGRRLPVVLRHSITHHQITVRMETRTLREDPHRWLDTLRGVAPAGVDWQWVPRAGLSEIVVSSLARKIESAWRADQASEAALFS